MPPLLAFLSPFPKAALKNCQSDILDHNLRSLFIISLLTAALAAFFSFFPLVIENQPDTGAAYLITAAAEFLTAWYASYLFKHRKHTPYLINAGFLLFYGSLIAIGIFLGIIKQSYEHISVILVFFVSVQILFVIDFPRSLILNLATMLVFSGLFAAVEPFNLWIFDLLRIGVVGLAGMVVTRYMYYTFIMGMLATRRLEVERNRFREESIKDELTGLSNRRDYHRAVNFYGSVCRHVHQTVCTIMMDVDFFKSYNDYYGHLKGDMVLQAIGRELKSLIEEEHVFAARVGGEEFMVLWTENRIAEAERVAIKLRQKIVDLRIPHERSVAAPYVTASLGLYILRGGSAGSAEDFYSNADAALYAAKRRGRNCIMLKDSMDQSLRLVEPLPPEKNVGRR
ncbi:MAG: GGDEF domain-containing protein [Spirochaetaceae bacterium]|jgi:diguanylate cyclase (GGDEF)-like protein|nr:GGDEF domain-containing protein [Spirochaetaceae bacterium]